MPFLCREVCAYCGVTKVKLHPTKNTKEVLVLVSTNESHNKKFFSFRQFIIDQYKQGNKACRGTFTAPQQTVHDLPVHSHCSDSMSVATQMLHAFCGVC